MILCRDMLVVGVSRKEGAAPPPEVNQEAGIVGGAGQVKKYITISNRA